MDEEGYGPGDQLFIRVPGQKLFTWYRVEAVADSGLYLYRGYPHKVEFIRYEKLEVIEKKKSHDVQRL